MHPSAMPSISLTPTTATKTPTNAPTFQPSSSPTIQPPCGFSCPPGFDGFLPQLDCVGFYHCNDGEMSHKTLCQDGLIYDEINQVCNWQWAVTECSCVGEGSQTDTPVYPPVIFPQEQCNTELRSSVQMGYYQSWAKNRFTDCNPVHPGEIDVEAFGYTHLVFSFAGISWEGHLEPYNNDESYFNQYSSFNSLKETNPNLKTLIAVGGWTFSQARFVKVSATDANRAAFASSVVTFLETHGFDGIGETLLSFLLFLQRILR